MEQSQGEATAYTKALPKVVEQVRKEVGKGVVGQQDFVDKVLLAILCRGHALIEGVPGVAKTLVVKLLARMLQVDFQRVQCTSDLMPADVIGGNVFNAANATFSLRKGPIFTDLLLVDEINRMPPRTQAALLESMEELQVTIDGARYALTEFFTVLATQNPVEFEGTYPLPEAQLDRFLLKIKVDYPGAEDEVAILEHHQNGFDARDLQQLSLEMLDTDLLRRARQEVRNVRVEPALFKYVSDVIRRTREWPTVSLGASPRAGVSLLVVSKALAGMEGRDYMIPDDVKEAALPCLRHRILLKPEAELEGIGADNVISDVLAAVEVPK
ncbi:MAG: MoxR family ATPase [Terriglobia bacterium]|nr:MoxR family ATPase [Terriglobia bacterium]